MTDKKANYTKSTEQLDLERRMAEDFESPKKIVEGEVPNQLQEGGFVNVDPIYQNYANEADAPLHAEEGVYADMDDQMFGKDEAKKVRENQKASASSEDDEDEEEDDKSTTKPTTKSTPASSSSTTTKSSSTTKSDTK